MAARGEVWNASGGLKSVNATDCLDTVRLLHQTVVCLRKALERSQSELHLLKSKVVVKSTESKLNNTIEQLALENHVLRRKILAEKRFDCIVEPLLPPLSPSSMDTASKSSCDERNSPEDRDKELAEEPAKMVGKEEKDDDEDENEGAEANDSRHDDDDHNFGSLKISSEDSEEVDDIELIFTTADDTKIGVQEELEPISDDGEEFESKSELNVSTTGVAAAAATHSVLVETDISKCGIVRDNDDDQNIHYAPLVTVDGGGRRKESSSDAKLVSPAAAASLPSAQQRPMLRETAPSAAAATLSVRDSEAQTDISAVPPHWKSESFLVNNNNSNKTSQTSPFPTLPSKFAVPAAAGKQASHKKCALKLAEKTREARRVLLSDINFTSMVPELSRSVDHLCANGFRLPTADSGAAAGGGAKNLRSPVVVSSGSSCSRFEFNGGGVAGHATSASNWNCYDRSYASDADRSAQDLQLGSARRRQSWRPSVFSLDTYYANDAASVPPSPTLRRHSAAIASFLNGSGDSKFCYALPDKFNVKTISSATLRNASTTSVNPKPKNRVSFKESFFSKNTGSRQSLPNMYVDTESGEESTDSLIDESEECVRKTIETTFNSIDWPYVGYRYVGRTCSVPNLFLEFSPPLSARPFIARTPNDLKANYFVKVINKDGRVVGGRVQFVGSVPGKSEPYIGILLPPNMGETDGSFQGFRYFACERNCGLFVPFRKVVMAWKV